MAAMVLLTLLPAQLRCCCCRCRRLMRQVWSWPGYEHLTTLAGGHACHHARTSGVTALAVSSKDR